MCEAFEVDPTTLDDDSLRELVVEVQMQTDRLEALRLLVLGEWDKRAVWAEDGAVNGAAWLSAQGNVARSHMHSILHDARRLRTMCATSDALTAGTLAPTKARMLTRVVNERTRDAFERDEQLLVDTISGLTVEDAANVLRMWKQLADEDGPKPDDRDANALFLSQTLEGRFHGKFDLDVESGTMFFNALSAHVTRIREERRQQGQDLTGKGPQLRADAFLDLVRRSTAVGDDQESARPLLWIIAAEEQLATGKGVVELAGGGVISAMTAQRLTCDCDFARVLMDPHGNRIDLNRAQRRASATQRRLLWLRDGGCTFPGCGRPPGWCDAHHIIFWENDGLTNLNNLALLCSHHHHLCHEGGFRLVREDDELVFYRPDGTRLEAPCIAA